MADMKPSTTTVVPHTFHWLAANPGKHRTEIIYLLWFLLTVPVQAVVVLNLSYDRPNDPAW